MLIIKALLQKEIIALQNTYFKARDQKQGIIALFFLGSTTTLGIIWYLAVQFKQMLEFYPVEMAIRFMIFPFLNLILLWSMVSDFTAMLYEVRLKFYLSPELKLLIPSPISATTLFIFKFLWTTCFSAFAMGNRTIFVLSPLIALGIASLAPWHYFLFLMPIVYLLSVISASLGALLSIFLTRILTTKRLIQIITIFGLLWSGFLIFIFIWEDTENLLSLLMNLTEATASALFFLNDAVKSLINIIQGNTAKAFELLLRLFLTSGVILFISMFIAGRVYYSGYDKVQATEGNVKIKTKRLFETFSAKSKWGNLVFIEWIKALRNHEMAQGSIFIVIVLFSCLFFASRIELSYPYSMLIQLINISAIGFLITVAVEMLFVPLNTDAVTHKDLLKDRYGLLKAAPISGIDFMWCQWLASFVPIFFLGGSISIIFNFLTGNSVLVTFLSFAVLSLLTGSVNLLALALYIERPTEQHETYNSVFGALRKVLPFLYYIFALSILAIGLVHTHIRILNFLNNTPEWLIITISGVIFLVLSCITICYSFRLGVKQWERMEI
ncbi:MAG: hypothetical protein KGZ50_08005 [Peptococcaceae bacterium]|nr:hypothetical protein [Peptococcaceae bacterium]